MHLFKTHLNRITELRRYNFQVSNCWSLNKVKTLQIGLHRKRFGVSDSQNTQLKELSLFRIKGFQNKAALVMTSCRVYTVNIPRQITFQGIVGTAQLYVQAERILRVIAILGFRICHILHHLTLALRDDHHYARNQALGHSNRRSYGGVI